MIFGFIQHIDKEKNIYPTALQKGLEYIRDTDFAALPEGKYPIDGDKIFAMVSDYLPEAKEVRKAETHGKYIDIQYIASGEEIMGIAPLSSTAEILEDCLAEKDAIFYSKFENEIELQTCEGMYVVFFPWDIHRPGCVSRPGVKVRKVVLKIATTEVFSKP